MGHWVVFWKNLNLVVSLYKYIKKNLFINKLVEYFFENLILSKKNMYICSVLWYYGGDFGFDRYGQAQSARSEMRSITLIYGFKNNWRNFRKTSVYWFDPNWRGLRSLRLRKPTGRSGHIPMNRSPLKVGYLNNQRL